jgi:hypothetical protein
MSLSREVDFQVFTLLHLWFIHLSTVAKPMSTGVFILRELSVKHGRWRNN